MSSATTAGLREQCFKLDIWWDGYSAIYPHGRTGSQMGYKGEDKSRAVLARLTNFSFCREPHWEPVHWLISFHCGSVANSSLSYFAQAQQASSRSA